MKSGELAQRIYVSDSLVRHWTGEFAEFLSDGASPDRAGMTREFDEDDQLVLATVAALRAEGDGYDEIREKLRNGARLEALPPAPEHGLTRPGSDPPVSPERYRAALRRMADKDERIAELEAQVAKKEELYERLIANAANGTADKVRIAELETELRLIKGSLWYKLFGGNHG